MYLYRVMKEIWLTLLLKVLCMLTALIDMYISTGPIPSTIVDFWRMIWEYKLPTIVMLTQLIEKGIVSKNSIDTII